MAFFDLCFTHVNSTTNLNHTTKEVFARHEQENVITCFQRKVHLLLWYLGLMETGKECGIFFKILATKLADKENSRYESTLSWIRTQDEIIY